jgi:hypothetical protein
MAATPLRSVAGRRLFHNPHPRDEASARLFRWEGGRRFTPAGFLSAVKSLKARLIRYRLARVRSLTPLLYSFREAQQPARRASPHQDDGADQQRRQQPEALTAIDAGEHDQGDGAETTQQVYRHRAAAEHDLILSGFRCWRHRMGRRDWQLKSFPHSSLSRPARSRRRVFLISDGLAHLHF